MPNASALKRVDYDQLQHAVYAKGRALNPAAVDRWMKVFGEALSPERPLCLADLGSGTGRFTPALAETFGGRVYGVEPSERMRATAQAQAGHPRVQYLAGEAGNIPLDDSLLDGVLMFLSFHHVTDRPAAAREIARVLKPGAPLLMRSTFAGRVPDIWWRRFFPRTWEIEEVLFPSVEQTARLFADAGLDRAEMVRVELPFDEPIEEAADRLRLRAISIFEHLTEDELEQGFAQMDAALAAETLPTPVSSFVDLLVMRSPG